MSKVRPDDVYMNKSTSELHLQPNNQRKQKVTNVKYIFSYMQLSLHSGGYVMDMDLLHYIYVTMLLFLDSWINTVR